MVEDPSSSAAPSPAIPDHNSLKAEPLNNNNNDNPTSQPGATIAPTPSITSYSRPPSFRPVAAQFYQNHSFGVGVPPMMAPYQVQPGFQTPRPPFTPIPNGYQGTIAPPPGILSYPSLYPTMVRPLFLPHPPGAFGVVPAVPRPLIPGIPVVRPVISQIIRPVVPSVTPAEKPQTTVYVGKIAPSVENDFMSSLLQLCGPVKSWRRPQDPANGTPRGFGFCEFEYAEGVLRALRLLTKFNIDRQELMLNVDQATKEYLERYVEKKTENSKIFKETQAAGADKEYRTGIDNEKGEPPISSINVSINDSDKGNKENHDHANFGIVTDEDKEGDREAMENLTSMIEERVNTKPLPPPPPPSQAPADGSVNPNLELPSKSRDVNTDADIMRSQREIERYGRETERERVWKEREQRRKIEEAERVYEERLKDWECRGREKEKQRQYEKERDKERERKLRKEILHDEEDEDDDSRKRWHRSFLEDRRRKRLQEKEDDLADRLKEEEEISETKRRDEEEKLLEKQRDPLKLLSGHVSNGSDIRGLIEGPGIESTEKAVEKDYGVSGNENHTGDGILQNGVSDESNMASTAESDMRQSGSAPARKLGFGLVGSGKRAAVPSVFHEEEDDDAHKEKKMRPLVPIDYSNEELQAVQHAVSGAQPPNLVAAAEFAKRISNDTPKEEKPDVERSRRSHDRSRQRDRDCIYDDINRSRYDNKEKVPEWDRDRNREHGLDKVKTPDKQKLLDAKQLIDMIPKTKEELFSYEINWAMYDKHELHERMRPWISKKITEFLGEVETTLVDYIVSSTQDHVKASQMLEMLQAILDDEAEIFVLKMWRMLIFEIKKVETGLSLRSKS
nr:RNA-binding protein 25-like isoform X1 [Populus alba]